MASFRAIGRTGTPLFVFAALVLIFLVFGFRSLFLVDPAVLTWPDIPTTSSKSGIAAPGQPTPEIGSVTGLNRPATQDDPALPSEYSLEAPSWLSSQLSGFCKSRYTTSLLEGFREHRAQYCSEASQSRFTCFHTPSAGSIFGTSLAGSNDSLCIAQHGIFFDVRRHKFALDCDTRQTGHEAATGMIPLAKLNSYQYLTGPKYLLKQWLDLKVIKEHDLHYPTHLSEAGQPRTGFVLLLKREVDGNIFHNMNEIMAIMISLDVLSMTPDPTSTSGAALFSPENIADTQIVILDEHPDGPLFDLFSMFSTKKPLRVREWIASTEANVDAESGEAPVDSVILPLAGAANNLWADFINLECEDNEMLRVFVRRVFDLFGIPRRRPAAPTSPAITTPRLNVTLIHRRSSRKLMGLDSFLLDAARAQFAEKAEVRLVDFAELTLREQIQVSRDSDVLVGMHGAGLTHAMFMEEGRGAVVEIQPDRMCYKGFENLVRMGGRAYLAAGANKIVGNCYDSGEEDGQLEMMSDGGTINDVSTSRCYSNAADPDAWSFACSDTALTGGDQSFMVCRHQDESDEWYKTCEGMEAGDIWWIARYVMRQERFLEVISQAMDIVWEQQKLATVSGDGEIPAAGNII